MKKMGKCLLSFLLCLGLLCNNMPLMASAAVVDSSTQTNVDKVISYATQLANANGDFTTSYFSWDTENKGNSWAYFNGLMMDAYMDLDSSAYSTRVANFYNTNIGGTSYTSGLSSVALDSVEPIRALFDILPASTGTTRTTYQNALTSMYNYVMKDISYSNCDGNLAHRLDSTGTSVYSSWTNYPVALDGLYMAQPFLMECANAIDEGNLTISGVSSSTIYAGVYNRLAWIYNNMYDSSTHLYYHAYNPTTGQNNGITWSRGEGWYVMALVDIIEMMPEGTYKTDLISELPRIFDGLLEWQDSSTGMWYNVTAYNSSLSKNQLETSGTSMFAYAMIKAYQKGYVTDSKYYDAGVKAFNGVVNNKMTGSAGNYSVSGTYLKSGAGNYASYYTTNGYTTNEAKGVGALIMDAALLQNGTESEVEESTAEESTAEESTVKESTTEESKTEESTQEESQTATTVTYQLADNITAGNEYVIASGNSGTVTIIANNNGSATGVSGTVTNGTLTFSNADDATKSLWTFASDTSGLISNNGLYACLGSYSAQFSTSGQALTISNKGNGAYQIYRTSRSGSGSVLYLNPANLSSKTTTATTVYLYEKVASAAHTWNDGEITTPATCTEEGVMTYTCTDCGATRTEAVAALGHSWDEGKVTTAATCTEKGVKTWTCANCGAEKTEAIPAAGHTVVIDEAVPATCTETGLTEGSHCSACNTVIKAQESVPVIDHTWDEGKITTSATCTANGIMTWTCTVCGTEKTEALPVVDHSWDEGNVTTAATCTEEGVKTWICANCGAEKTEAIEALGHSWDEGKVTTAATCTEEGVKTWTCANCGAEKTEAIEALGHSWDEGKVTTAATCTEEGVKTWTCGNCGAEKTETIEALGHTVVKDAAVAATCIRTGLTEGCHCSVCNIVINAQQTVPVTDHSWDEGKVTTAATATTDGVMTYTCTICQETKTEMIPATGEIEEPTVEAYQLADSITAGNEYVIASGNNGTVTIIANNNGSAAGVSGTVSDGTLTFNNSEDESKSLWTFASATSGMISNNGLYASLGSYSAQFSTSGLALTITNKGNGAYQISRTSRSGSGSVLYLNPANLSSKTTTATTVYLYEKVTVTGHNWDNGKVTTAATCTENGTKTYTCTVCGATKTEAIPAAGHTAVKDAAVAATCVETGLTEGSHCSVCGTVISAQQTTAALGHTWNSGTVTTAATTTEDGVMTYTCTVCGATKTEAIPATVEGYKLATSITAGKSYVIASGNNGTVTVIANNNGTAAKVNGTVTNGVLTFSNTDYESKSLWTFASATKGKIYNNGLYIKISSSSQFNTSGETLTITSLGSGAYRISKTTSSGSTYYLNPGALTGKTSTATTVYLYEKTAG